MTVKIWDISTMKCVGSFHGHEGVVYSISWAPGDDERLVAGTSKARVFMWDARKGQVINRFKYVTQRHSYILVQTAFRFQEYFPYAHRYHYLGTIRKPSTNSPGTKTIST